VGIPRTRGLLYLPWQPLRIPSTIIPIGQLQQTPSSPIPGDLERGPSHQSHVLEHGDTYGQTQVCSKSYQGSSVNCKCKPSFCWIKFCHVRSPLHTSIRLRLSVSVRYWVGQEVRYWAAGPAREKFILNGFTWEKNQRTYHLYTPTAWPLKPLGVINTAATRGGNAFHFRGGGGPVRKDTSPFNKKIQKNRRRDTRAIEVKNLSPSMICYVLDATPPNL